MIFYIVLGISAFLFSLLGTRIAIATLRERQVPLAAPSNHIAPTPRGGGIVVVFSLLICLAQLDVGYSIMFSLLMLTAFSLLGDLMRVPQSARLIAQAFAVCIPLSAMPLHIAPDFIPMWATKLCIGVLWVWFINLFKFMDGIDGLTSAVMIGIGGGLCLLVALTGRFPDPLLTYGLVLVCAASGFLWWNWHPAKIFLGEVGSTPLGLFCFYLLLLAADSGYAFSAAILPAYYFCDGTITILRRLWKRKKIWGVHNDYYYKRAVRAGRSHASVARYVFGINILLTMLAIFSALNPETGLINLATAYATVFILLGFFAHTPHDPDHELL
jgi:UDP-N-acetylmuramyl pentapeptide phosphotransferase/UDP-N-acetylglucosamine-1-phosphate transferase